MKTWQQPGQCCLRSCSGTEELPFGLAKAAPGGQGTVSQSIAPAASDSWSGMENDTMWIAVGLTVKWIRLKYCFKNALIPASGDFNSRGRPWSAWRAH